MKGKAVFKIWLVTVILVLTFGTYVYAYTGKGTKSNPYTVTAESGLREILMTKGRSSWTYIAVNGTINISKTISISEGKFKIYAKGAGRTIRRTSDLKANINDQMNPGYCMTLNGGVTVEFGSQDLSNYKLKLGGYREIFENGKKSSGWLYIKDKAAAVLGKNSHMTNVINNKEDTGGAPIRCAGELTLNGEISNCTGFNGGVVKVQGGRLTINSNTNIHNCNSNTEGGAIYGYMGCSVNMNGGIISNCNAKEEGGAIFIGGVSTCKINSGLIKNNKSGNSAGGVFSGYGANLYIGNSSGTGPEISYNHADGSGGGVRCNGGNTDESGGTSYFYGGSINNNSSGKNGGGISCGEGGTGTGSRLVLKNISVSNNSSITGGGGIRIPRKVVGVGGNNVLIENCKFIGNITNSSGGGIILYCSVQAVNTVFANNKSSNNGGAININDEGIMYLKDSFVYGNITGKRGSGVYVDGGFRISGKTYINSENIVYLTSGTYIDVVGKLSNASGLIAKIESEIKDNGTKLIKANYAGSTASEELYYNNISDDEYGLEVTNKKYSVVGLNSKQLLRPSEKVNGYEKNWIIISEKYEIKFDKNCDGRVENLPLSQRKFWNENITINTKNISRTGYVLNIEKHWNTENDSKGQVIKPGEIFTLNRDTVLYAIWKIIDIKEINIIATDRYYVIKQKIILSKNELFKKVLVKDDLGTGYDYNLRITQIKLGEIYLQKADDIIPEKIINTEKASHYVLTLETENSKGSVRAKAYMNVYVLQEPPEGGRIRFISFKYIDTLDTFSKWYTEKFMFLNESLKKEEGQGMYKLNFSSKKIRAIKENIFENNYIITKKMNRSLRENW